MDKHRDRASGWKHAKLSGHVNEAKIEELLNKDEDFREDFLSRTGNDSEKIVSASVGGLHEKSVPGVLGEKTKSKTDLTVSCESGRQINVSIKKSLGGQVYLVGVDTFIKVYEKRFGEIPNDVKRAMRLFWAGAPDADEIIEQYADKDRPKEYRLQLKHHSLNAETMKKYDASLYEDMLQWFKDNADNMAKLCFSMGAASNSADWSEFVWYINALGENDVDDIFSIETICNAAQDGADHDTFYGDTNGGTTIQLPFGFVQWHQKSMQFHHGYEKVKELCERRTIMGAYDGATRYFGCPLEEIAVELGYSGDNLLILQGDEAGLKRDYPDTYRNLLTCKHQKDGRGPMQYGRDLVASWIVEDKFLEVLNTNGLCVELAGADKNRVILSNAATSASGDYAVSYKGITRKLELMNDYTGYWGKKHVMDLRDSKFDKLQKEKSLFLAVSMTTKEFALLDFSRNDFTFEYIPSHFPYGGKPAYEISLPNEIFQPVTEQNMTKAVIARM